MNRPGAEHPAGRAGAGGPPAVPRPVVLVGLMGAGKSRVGRMLADRLGIGFVDNDNAVEEAAGMDITGIFEVCGEDAFRDLEARVLKGILDGPARIVATGGGAFMNGDIRAIVRDRALSVWLKADPASLAARISNPDSRPLLKGRDPAAVLEALARERYPAYAEADLTVDTDGLSLKAAARKLEKELLQHLDEAGAAASP